MNDENDCQFVDGGIRNVPWCETHQRAAIVCMREVRQRTDLADGALAVASLREPTQEEGDALEGAVHPDGRVWPDGECFVPTGGWTGRRCRVCRRWVWGGPTACVMCADADAGEEQAQ